MNNLDHLQSIFRLVDRKIWIVTACDGEKRGGLAATWISQASIDPQSPIVLAGIAPNHYTRELIDGSGGFVLHLLSSSQAEMALNFAIGSGRNRDKLSGLKTTLSKTGNPVLEDSLAWMDCRLFARMDGGDRIYYWADVLDGNMSTQDTPLTEQALIAACDDQQKQTLLADRDHDIALHRPLRAAWRENLPPMMPLKSSKR